jgi:hypothetical protein
MVKKQIDEDIMRYKYSVGLKGNEETGEMNLDIREINQVPLKIKNFEE